MNEIKNTDLEQKFFQAVKNGHVDVVKQLVAEDKGLLKAYDYSEFGGPCLNLVVGFRQNMEMTKALIELGADVNQESDWWAGPWSAKILSMYYRDNGICDYLLSHGASVDVFLASGVGLVNELKSILKEQPELVHARGGDGCMPLHFAGTCEVVDILLDHQADLEARDIDHYSTPVQWAAGRDNEVARYMFNRGAKADIFSLVLSGACEIAEHYLNENPDAIHMRMNQQSYPPSKEHDVHNIMTFTVGEEGTLLHAASSGNQPQMIKSLIDKGMDVNITGAYDDSTALHSAAWNDFVDVAKVLIDSGADINKLSGEIHNNSPLGWAIVAGSSHVAELLLKHQCEKLDFFVRDAQYGVDGGFDSYKAVAKEKRIRILELLNDK